MVKQVPCECMSSAGEALMLTDIALELAEYEARKETPPWLRPSPDKPYAQERAWQGWAKEQTAEHKLVKVRSALGKLEDNCGVDPVCQAPMCRGRPLSQIVNSLIENARRGRFDKREYDMLVDGLLDNLLLACRS